MFSFVQLHQEQELIYWVDNVNTCFNRPCFYLNEITTSMELFIKNFFFLWSLHFSAFEPPNSKCPKKYIQFLHWPPTLSPHSLKQVQEKHEPNLSQLISSVSTLVSTSRITINKICWLPQVRFLITCSNLRRGTKHDHKEVSSLEIFSNWLLILVDVGRNNVLPLRSEFVSRSSQSFP